MEYNKLFFKKATVNCIEFLLNWYQYLEKFWQSENLNRWIYKPDEAYDIWYQTSFSLASVITFLNDDLW